MTVALVILGLSFVALYAPDIKQAYYRAVAWLNPTEQPHSRHAWDDTLSNPDQVSPWYLRQRCGYFELGQAV